MTLTPPRIALLGSGVLMCAYLALRPYADTTIDLHAAHGFASNRWVAAHVCGATALVLYAWFTCSVLRPAASRLARLAAITAVIGVALALPYYGAETFGLHEVGLRVLAGDHGALALVNDIRNQPVAIATFGIGLVLVIVSGVLTALGTARAFAPTWVGIALGVLVALFPLQFFTPPAARVAFGVVYGVTAVVAALRLGDAGSARGAEGSSHEVVHQLG